MKKHKKNIRKNQKVSKKSIVKITKKIAQTKKKKNIKKAMRKKIKKILFNTLGWKSSVALFIAQIICGLISTKSIWQKEIAASSKDELDEAKIESKVKRLQRFLYFFSIDYYCFSLMLYHMMGPSGKVTIILDRTNWDFGKSHINIFVAAVLYRAAGTNQTFAIPIVWEVFDKKGNSNTRERKQIIKRVLDVVGKQNIEAILGDREFIGEEWIQHLDNEGIPFIIRIKKNMYVEYQGNTVQVCDLFESIIKGEKLVVQAKLNDVPIQLAATRSNDGEFVIVAASHDVEGDPLDQYRLRWVIELFFKSIKSKGFNFEETHVTDPERIKKLFALTALATLIIVQAGAVHNHIKKVPVKNHGRFEFSLFTYGRDFIIALFNGEVPDNFDFIKCFSFEIENLFFHFPKKPLFALRMG